MGLVDPFQQPAGHPRSFSANVQFALGGRVAGGRYGEARDLACLSASGNPAHALDFRNVYAAVLERW